MKIVNFETFMALPNGTVFSKYEPCRFDGLKIKVDTCGENDFFYHDLICEIGAMDTADFFSKCNSKMENGESVDVVFDLTERDGLYETNQLFAIYEKTDIGRFIKRLIEARDQGYP